MARRVAVRGGWVLTFSALGLVAISCGGNVDDDTSAAAGTSSGRTDGSGGGTGGTGNTSGGKAAGGKPNGAAGSKPSFGGCIGVKTSGGSPLEGCDEPEPPPCSDHRDVASCEAAGCIATTGDVSTLLPEAAAGAGGATNAAGAPATGGVSAGGAAPAACQLTEDVFISCEEGYGGALFQIACTDDCSSCMGGPWTVGRHAPYTNEHCDFWSCVDGRVKR